MCATRTPRTPQQQASAPLAAASAFPHAGILREPPEAEMLVEMLDGGEAMLTQSAGNGAGARLCVLALPAEAGSDDALTAEGFAQVLELLCNPFQPLARAARESGGLTLALGEHAMEPIPAAHFLNAPPLLALGAAALAERLAGELSWSAPAEREPASDDEDAAPRDQALVEFGQRYSLPRATAPALVSIARNPTRSCRGAAGVAARVLAAASEPTRRILLEQVVAHSQAEACSRTCACFEYEVRIHLSRSFWS
jgi:hypothetical protein